jgi:hypothetical protein
MAVASYKAVLKHFQRAPEDVRQYFQALPFLTQNCGWDVCVAYQFIRLETAQNRALYCGLVKLHRAEPNVTDSFLASLHLTRASFLVLMNVIFSTPVPPAIVEKLKNAESVRDRIVHGKGHTEPDARQAMVDSIDYATELNSHLEKCAGFRPFGDLRGFKGAAASLDKHTTSWLLKGFFSSIRPPKAKGTTEE